MSCTLMTDKDGNRMIVCRRGEPRPVLQEARAIVKPSSPWQIGKRVKHGKHGMGVITGRNEMAVSVHFDGQPIPKCFMLSLIGDTMKVLP